ncbi:MAG: ATP-binding cassette domain-containing protein [Myxococcota bacterium]
MPGPDSASALPLAFEDVCLDAGGARRLHDVSFRVEAGSLSVLLGPNGAGKSLCLRLAAGLLDPSAGQVRWLGPTPAAARSAIVLQRPVLLRRSVRANLAYPLRLAGVAWEEAEERITRVLAATRLSELAGRPARRLSVGEQQRVALAQAWVRQPAVLLLDEPTAALDPGATGALEAAVHALRAEDVKVVMSTHDLGQARRMADEVLFLHRGRLLEQTPAEAFFREPRSPEARKFLAGEILG